MRTANKRPWRIDFHAPIAHAALVDHQRRAPINQPPERKQQPPAEQQTDGNTREPFADRSVIEHGHITAADGERREDQRQRRRLAAMGMKGDRHL